MNKSVPFAFGHVACEGCAADWEPWILEDAICSPRKPWTISGTIAATPSDNSVLTQRYCPTRGCKFILHLLSSGAKKGGKDWCKIAQTVCLEDIVQGGVTKYFHCGGTGVCQPGMVQSSTKGSAPWLLPHGHSSEDWAWRAYTEELDLSYTGFKLMNEDMVIGLDIKTLSGWAGCALIARKLLHFWRSTAALYKPKGNLQTSAQRYS